MRVKSKTSYQSPDIIYPEGADQINHWIDHKGKEHFKEISHKKPPLKENWKIEGKEIIEYDKNKKAYLYYIKNTKTGRKIIKIYDNGVCLTYDKKRYIQLNSKIEKFFSSNDKRESTYNDEEVKSILREKYAFNIIITLLNNKEITVMDFSKNFNIKEQMARKHLNKFVNKGLLLTLKIHDGKIIYKLAIEEEKIKNLMRSF